MVLANVSAIHDISRSPVLMSGAGTSIPGPAITRKHGAQITISKKHHEHKHHMFVCGLTDEALLGKLDGEPPGDFLQLRVLKTNQENSV